MKNWTPGSSFVPARTKKNDAQYELKIDAKSIFKNEYRNVYLQVNKEAKSPTFRDWNKRKETHANLIVVKYEIRDHRGKKELSSNKSSLRCLADAF